MTDLSNLSKLKIHVPAHVYSVAPRNDGRWGVWCYACSETAEDYVYPCRELKARRNKFDRNPPAVLAEPGEFDEALARLETANGVMARIADLLGLWTEDRDSVSTEEIYGSIIQLREDR